MSWQLNQIPKVLHVYWGNDKLPLMRYITVKSFSDLNPDWTIKFWVPRVKSERLEKPWDGPNHKAYGDKSATNCIDLLDDIPNLEICVFDFESPFDDASDVYRSDFLRLDVLHSEGGFWADMDIVFIKPMEGLSFNGHNSLIQSIVCHSNDDGFGGHSIGFLGASAGSMLFEELRDRSKMLYKSHEYQAIGRLMFAKFCPQRLIERDGRIFNFDRRIVYPFNFKDIRETINNTSLEIPENTIGIHWYAGDAQLGSCCAHVTADKIRAGRCVLYNEMRRFL